MTKFSKALREIRPLIKSGKQIYICLALESIGKSLYKKNIEALLGRSHSYGLWIRLNHTEVWNRMIKIPGSFKQGRLQWIDWLIDQEERK